MGNIQQTTKTFSAAFGTRHVPSMLLRFICVLVAGMTFISMGAITLAYNEEFPENPFLGYEDIFPGQPVSAVTARAFDCQQINSSYTSEERCALDVETGVFERIETVNDGSSIRQLTFTLRDSTFKVGDLSSFFDTPDLSVYPSRVFFFWDHFFAAATTSVAGDPVIHRPVWSVTFSTT